MVFEMVTRTEYEMEFYGFLSEMWSLCTVCGKCCSGLKIPLYPHELPIIFQSFKSEEELKTHVKKNLYPFNIQSEYYLVTHSKCPFLEDKMCRIYTNRPLVCRLFPIRLSAFLDKPVMRFRDPLLPNLPGEPHHSCWISNTLFLARMMMFSLETGKAGEKLIDYLMAAVLDDLNFAFLYGQSPLRDSHAFNPRIEPLMTYESYAKQFTDSLFRIYNNPDLYTVEVWDRLQPIDEEDVDRIRSRKSLKEASAQLTRLKKRIMKHNPSVAIWRKNIRGHVFKE